MHLLASVCLYASLAVSAVAYAQQAGTKPDEAPLEMPFPVARGILPILVSSDWSKPLPTITRAVIVVHDVLRDAQQALRIVQQAEEVAGISATATLLIAPKFVDDADVVVGGLPDQVLRWATDKWQDGDPALGPVPLSSYDALDAIVRHLADPSLFPALRQVVMAGHATGAQMLQRYAVVGHGEWPLAVRGIKIRYVIANAPSYLWFGPDRPRPLACLNADHWPSGLVDAPAYVGPVRGMERRAIARDVIYLLSDTAADPVDPFRGLSCAVQAQGESVFARGMHYLLSLEIRHPNLVRHRVLMIRDVERSEEGMFGSACGLAALFDLAGCAGF